MARRRTYDNTESEVETSSEDTVGTLEEGGQTAEEKAEADAKAAAEVVESAHLAAIVAAVEKVRVVTSHLDDLVHRFDKGLPVERQHVGDVKTHLDAIVQELVDAAGLA